jgi:hypothetical protein
MQNSQKLVVIFSSLNLTEVHLVQSFLKDQGYRSTVRGALRSVLGGEVPMDDARIELLVSCRHASAALTVIKQHQEKPANEWVCLSCHQPNPGSFEFCWQCETPLKPI